MFLTFLLDVNKEFSPILVFASDVVQASLTYAEAQMRIDDTTMNDDITKSLRGLNKLAKILKKKRIDMG